MGSLESLLTQSIMTAYGQARKEDPLTAHQRTKEASFQVLRDLGYYSPLEECYDNQLRLYKKTSDVHLKEVLHHNLTVLREALSIVYQLGLDEKRDEYGRRYREDTQRSEQEVR